MRITNLARGKKQNRINVFVDHEYSFSVEENTLIKFGLYLGQEIEAEQVEEIRTYDLIEYLFSKGVDQISRRPRSIKEARDYLKERLMKRLEKQEFDHAIDLEKIIDSALLKLEKNGFLNDEEFARWFVEGRIKRRKKGAREIEMELMKFGVDREIVRIALAEVQPQGYAEELLNELIDKKLNTSRYKNLPNREKKQKLFQFLSQKGFQWDQFQKLVEEKIK